MQLPNHALPHVNGGVSAFVTGPHTFSRYTPHFSRLPNSLHPSALEPILPFLSQRLHDPIAPPGRQVGKVSFETSNCRRPLPGQGKQNWNNGPRVSSRERHRHPTKLIVASFALLFLLWLQYWLVRRSIVLPLPIAPMGWCRKCPFRQVNSIASRAIKVNNVSRVASAPPGNRPCHALT